MLHRFLGTRQGNSWAFYFRPPTSTDGRFAGCPSIIQLVDLEMTFGFDPLNSPEHSLYHRRV